MVLGSGGASLTARAALKDLGASRIVTISRSASDEKDFDTYDHLAAHADAEIIINTTPVGMYPGNGEKLLSLQDFPACRGVADVIYNPARTAILLEAEELGIPYTAGLGMLVSQARRSAELWLMRAIPDEHLAAVRRKLGKEMENIVLIGMPGSGKSSVGRKLAGLTGRKFVDTDEVIEQMTGRKVPAIIGKDGEDAFRLVEGEAIAVSGKESGCVIATGGGCVTRERNYLPLHQNSRIVWIRRDLKLLPTEGRPLSRAAELSDLYEARKDLYARFADFVIDNDGTVEETAERILDLF